MKNDEIRERIATALDMDCDEIWFGILDNATPGHYGVEDLSVRVAKNDIQLNMPERTFTFKEAALSFSARLMSSREEDGVDIDFKKVVSGAGAFDFNQTGGIQVEKFAINEEIEFFEREPAY